MWAGMPGASLTAAVAGASATSSRPTPTARWTTRPCCGGTATSSPASAAVRAVDEERRVLTALRSSAGSPVPGDLRGHAARAGHPDAGPHVRRLGDHPAVRCCRPSRWRRCGSSTAAPPRSTVRPVARPSIAGLAAGATAAAALSLVVSGGLTSTNPHGHPRRCSGPSPRAPVSPPPRSPCPGSAARRPATTVAPAVGTVAVVRHNRLHERRARPGRPRPADASADPAPPSPPTSTAPGRAVRTLELDQPPSTVPRRAPCRRSPAGPRPLGAAGRLGDTPSRSTCSHTQELPGAGRHRSPAGRRPPTDPVWAAEPTGWPRRGTGQQPGADATRPASRRPPSRPGSRPSQPATRHTRPPGPAAPQPARAGTRSPAPPPTPGMPASRRRGSVTVPPRPRAPQQKGPGWGALVAVAAVAALVAAGLGGVFGGWLGATGRVDFGWLDRTPSSIPSAGAGATVAAGGLDRQHRGQGAAERRDHQGRRRRRRRHRLGLRPRPRRPHHHQQPRRRQRGQRRHDQGRAVQRHRDRRHDRRARQRPTTSPSLKTDRTDLVPLVMGVVQGRRRRRPGHRGRCTARARVQRHQRHRQRAQPPGQPRRRRQHSSRSSTPSRPTRRSTPATAADRCSTCPAR